MKQTTAETLGKPIHTGRYAVVHKDTGEVVEILYADDGDGAPELRENQQTTCDLREVADDVVIGSIRVWDEPEPDPYARAHHYKVPRKTPEEKAAAAEQEKAYREAAEKEARTARVAKQAAASAKARHESEQEMTERHGYKVPIKTARTAK